MRQKRSAHRPVASEQTRTPHPAASPGKKDDRQDQRDQADLGTRFENARAVATDFAGVLNAGGRGHGDGLGELGRALFDFDQEIADDGVEHVKAIARAKILRGDAELSGRSYAHRRVETSGARIKEVAELAKVKPGERSRRSPIS